MLDEQHFLAVAEATLAHLHDQLEDVYDEGALEELDLVDGTLRIESANGTCWIVNKHSASRQIWLASPISGGLQFNFNHDHQTWELADGRELKALLSSEIQDIIGLHIIF